MVVGQTLSSANPVVQLFQDRETGVKNIVVHSWINRAGESVGDMQKLVAETDGVPRVCLDTYSTPDIDQKIQSGCAGNVNRDGLAGSYNTFVGLKERIHLVAAAEIHGESQRRDTESIHGMSRLQ